MSTARSILHMQRTVRWPLIGSVALALLMIVLLVPSARAASCPPLRSHTGQQLDALGVPGEAAAQVKEAELCAAAGLPTTSAVPAAPGDGFDWGDAGIGVALTFGALLLTATGAIAVRKHGWLAHQPRT